MFREAVSVGAPFSRPAGEGPGMRAAVSAILCFVSTTTALTLDPSPAGREREARGAIACSIHPRHIGRQPAFMGFAECGEGEAVARVNLDQLIRKSPSWSLM